MDKIIAIIVRIIEKPDARKPYEDFYNYLKSVGREDEANGILYLIGKRFDVNNSSISAEQ